MTIDEAIARIEETADIQERIAKIYETDIFREDAKESVQVAEWLKELKDARTLLKAAYDLLKKQEDSFYVLNLLEEIVYYDGVECDGGCLMEDIGELLGEDGE